MLSRLRGLALSSGGDDDLPELWRVSVEGANVVVMEPDGHVTSVAEGVRALLGRRTSGAAPEIVAHGRLRLGDQVRVFVGEGTVSGARGTLLSRGLDRPVVLAGHPRVTAEGLELSDGGLSWLRVRGELQIAGALLRGSARALSIGPGRGGGSGSGGAPGSIDVRGLDADLVLPRCLGALLAKDDDGAPGCGSVGPERALPAALRVTDATLRVSLEGADRPALLLDKMDLVARARTASLDVRARQLASLPSGLRGWMELSAVVSLPSLSPRRTSLRVRGLPLADLARDLGAGELVRGGEADLTLDWTAPHSGSGQRVEGLAELRELRLEGAALGPDPFVLGSIRVPLSLERERDGERVTLDMRGISTDDARLDLAIALAVGEGERRLTVRAKLPRQPCAAVLGAIPDGLIPRVDKGSLKDTTGMIEGSMDLRVDMGRPDTLGLSATGAATCELPRLSAELEAQLATLVPEAASDARDAVNPAVVEGFITLTDPTFRSHFGIALPRLERTLRTLAAGRRPSRWATSLTERLVEGPALDERPTVAGRVELALLAMRLEGLMTKDQISSEALRRLLEGELGAEGLAQAARALLGRPPAALTSLDIAYLVALGELGVDAPASGGSLPHALRDEILSGMRRLLLAGLITPKQFVDAAPYDPLAALDR